MSQKKASKSKARGLRSLSEQTLSAKRAKNVRGGGGRKAGKEQHEYLIIKMNDIIVT